MRNKWTMTTFHITVNECSVLILTLVNIVFFASADTSLLCSCVSTVCWKNKDICLW